MIRDLKNCKKIRRAVADILLLEETCTQEMVAYALFQEMKRIAPSTVEHCQQVGEYSQILALGMGMSEAAAEEIRLAGILHDLGKSTVPNEIIDKPGKLTPEEYEVVKQHVIYGHDFLSGAKGRTLKLAARVALEHHERWDGNGYLGKAGCEICLEARIVSVADVFDALLSVRSYKKPWPPEECRAEIVRSGGTQFDPAVTEVFDRCFGQLVEAIPAQGA